jgi:hypothetical protein
MALTMSSINYDAKRAFNKIEGFTVAQNYTPNGGDFPQPVPVEIALNLSILTRYQRDLDQILTCIFAYFYPYIIISYKHPDLGHEVRCKLEWNKAINLTYPLDIAGTQPYRIVADSTFTLQGWLYRNAYNNSGIIHNIPMSFNAVSALFDNYDYMHSLESDITSDYLEISGRPFIHSVAPYQVMPFDSGKTITIHGNMFDYLSGITLSGTSGVFEASSYQTFDPYVSSHRLSAIYPAFTAVSTEYTVIDNNNITFVLPQINTSGFFDIMGYGMAGVGKLTEDAIAHNSTVQWPYISGIQIL